MRKRRLLFACLVFAALIPLRARDASAQSDADLAAVVLSRSDLDPSLRQRLHLYRLIDDARASAGLPGLAMDARLMDSANAHSADMALARRCSHTGRDGSSAKARIRQHGYPHNNWAGENIICARQTPEDAMRWWMASGPHRRNILHHHYTHIGIGYDPNGPYGPMWTLNFAAGSPESVVPAFLLEAGANPAGPLAEAR